MNLKKNINFFCFFHMENNRNKYILCNKIEYSNHERNI